MNILLIPDKFKGSITAESVLEALSRYILKSMPETEIFKVMASDGGDGFLDAVQWELTMPKFPLLLQQVVLRIS